MAPDIPLEELQQGVQAVTWQRGTASLAVLVGSVFVAKLAGHLVRWVSTEARGPAFAFSKLLTYGLAFAGIVTSLAVLGIPLSSLVLTSSALLVGIGFSLQHVARDIVAGIVILVEQSIRKNDFVQFAETRGTVWEIGLRATQLLTREGTVLVVPNHLLVTTELINHSHPFKRSRLRISIPADARQSADEARAAIFSVGANHPEVLPEPAPAVRLAAIERWGFKFELIVWVEEPIAARRIASELRSAVARAFEERGLRFPTSMLTLARSVAGAPSADRPPSVRD